MKLLLDEMYPPALNDVLLRAGVDAVSVRQISLTGAPDPTVFEAAVADGRAVLTENVADFVTLADERLILGGHHPGLLIALSSRFSRRPAGLATLSSAVRALSGQPIEDRILYLRRPPA